MIPKRFFMFWDGPNKPDYVKRAMESWHLLHPDWEIVELNAANIPTLRNQDLWDHWDEVSPKSNEWQFKTDIARLEILHDQGGVWVDADLQALKNIEPLIEGCQAFTSRESPKFVNNGFTGTAPGHAWYRDMMTSARGRVLQHPEMRSNRSVGPHLYTETIAKHGDVRVLPTNLIYPIDWREAHGKPLSTGEIRRRYPEAYTVHHWNNKITGGKRG